MKKTDDIAALVARIGLAAIFLISGFGKLAAHEGTVGYIASVGLPAAELGYWIAVVVEILGGLAIVAGYKTRIVAPILAVFSLVTAVFFHNQLGDQNQMIHFLKNIGLAGGFLMLYVAGPGALSLDNRAAA